MVVVVAWWWYERGWVVECVGVVVVEVVVGHGHGSVVDFCGGGSCNGGGKCGEEPNVVRHRVSGCGGVVVVVGSVAAVVVRRLWWYRWWTGCWGYIVWNR